MIKETFNPTRGEKQYVVSDYINTQQAKTKRLSQAIKRRSKDSKPKCPGMAGDRTMIDLAST